MPDTATNCGKPKDDRDEERFPEDLSEGNALSGESRRKALAGPDWKCKFCDTLQNSLGKCCGHCGSDRSGAKSWKAGHLSVEENVETGKKKVRRRATAEDVDWDKVDRSLKSGKPQRPRIETRPLFEGGGGTFIHDAGTAEELTQPVQGRPATTPPVEFVPDTGGYRTPPKVFIQKLPFRMRTADWVRSRKLGLIRFGAIVLATAAITLLLWLLFRTRIVDARVSTVSWDHAVLIDRYQVVPKEGWDTDYGAFDVEDRGLRIHHYDHVRVGSHQERYQETYTCGENCTTVRGSCRTTTRTCTSNKNGTATCSGGDRVCDPDTRSCTPKTCTRDAYRTVDDYEDQPRYRTWHAWKVWEWHYNRTVRASGTSIDDLRWPSDAELTPSQLAQGEVERNRREESYKVVFSNSDDSWTIKPKTESDFRRFPPGSRYKLKVGIANGVTVLGQNGTTEEY